MADPPPPQMPPPNWYADPEMANTQRYWDGSAWTEHRAPGGPGGPKDNGGLITVGWLGALFFPLVGLVIGLVLMERGEKNQGGWITAVSAAWFVLAAILFFVLIGSSSPN
jgi:hypothetical protein